MDRPTRTGFNTTAWTLLVTGAASVGLLIGGELQCRSATAQSPVSPAVPGKYSLACGRSFLYLTDTTTGRVWIGSHENVEKVTWTELDTPVSPRRESEGKN